MMRLKKTYVAAPLITMIAACSGGGAGTAGDSTGVGAQTVACTGSCATNTPTALTAADVQTIIAQAVQEAQAQGQDATIAVTDRVGNVLGVYRMGDPSTRTVLIASQIQGQLYNNGNVPLDANGNGVSIVDSGLEGIKLPTAATQANIDDQAAITKAITGSYLSSEGNAFSSRTASHIIQENFNPLIEQNQASGPLFGVQLSQFSCSDFTNDTATVSVGPKRSPLGLSADPGGLPLYKNGTPVGGVGVIADGLYSLDKNIGNNDVSVDEMIALAATFNYAAPVDRRADRITVIGKTLRFSDVGFGDIMTDPTQATPLASISPDVGTLIPVTGYTDGTIKAGTAFGQPASGIRADAQTFPGQDAFIFVDAANNNRFPPKAGTDNLAGGASLTAAEVQTVLSQALAIANRSRAQIRRPTGSQARVTISVVDTQGEILGMVRTRDAPVFGADVSVQKARTATLVSSTTAANFLTNLPDAKYLNTPETTAPTQRAAIQIGNYVTALQTFVKDATALTNGIAFSDRAGGNLSRPFYPDGLTGMPNGPLSKAQGSWSVFSTGLQLDLAINAVLQHVLSTATGGVVTDVTDNCAGVNFDVANLAFTATATTKRAANGIQIFPGSVPIYRGNTLIGGIGVSGDGVDQDDMIAFLGVDGASMQLNGAINNAPMNMRADTITVGNNNLRYIQCPQAPFIDSNVSRVCMGK